MGCQGIKEVGALLDMVLPVIDTKLDVKETAPKHLTKKIYQVSLRIANLLNKKYFITNKTPLAGGFVFLNFMLILKY